MHQDGYSKYVLVQVLGIFAATSIGMITAAATHYLQRKSKHPKNHSLAPLLNRTESGRVRKLERFSDYVARQIGFKDGSECPELSKLAYEYLKRSKGCADRIYEYFGNVPDGECLCVKLIEEFERCILGYFAFHWNHASLLISQVLSVDSEQKKLKDFVMAATRKQRFEKISKDLKVTRIFSTLVEEMKAINGANGEAKCTEVMTPVAHSERSPVLLLMGGGMGAGKSTVLKDILKE